MPSKITDARKQLEALDVYQEMMESCLHKLTGLTVKVNLNVHTADNSETDLLHLYEASLSTPDFKQVITSGRTWIAHKDLSKNILVFMPKGFDVDELYPEPEDDEGYNLAVENANALVQKKPRIVEWAESDTDEPFDPSSTKRPF